MQKAHNKTKRLIPLAAHISPDRAFHLIDIENLTGSPRSNDQFMDHIIHKYQQKIPSTGLDTIVLAVNPKITDRVSKAWDQTAAPNSKWPKAKVISGHGPDGADKQLIRAASNHKKIIQNYGKLIIGSGDGIFTDLTKQYTSYGMEVIVIARKGSFSGRLRSAASDFLFIDSSKLRL